MHTSPTTHLQRRPQHGIQAQIIWRQGKAQKGKIRERLEAGSYHDNRQTYRKAVESKAIQPKKQRPSAKATTPTCLRNPAVNQLCCLTVILIKQYIYVKYNNNIIIYMMQVYVTGTQKYISNSFVENHIFLLYTNVNMQPVGSRYEQAYVMVTSAVNGLNGYFI